MQLSHLFSSCLVLLLAVPSHARLLKHPIIPRLQCLTRMYFFDLQVEDFDKYNTTYFGDDSTMTLAQAGTYYKADGIEEYTKYVQVNVCFCCEYVTNVAHFAVSLISFLQVCLRDVQQILQDRARVRSQKTRGEIPWVQLQYWGVQVPIDVQRRI